METPQPASPDARARRARGGTGGGRREAGGIAIEFPVHPIEETGGWPRAALDRSGYSSIPVSDSSHGLWEPEFPIADDGAPAMFWSDETDPCCSQKLAQIRTYDDLDWQNESNTVASTIQSDRPGMAVVTKLP